MISASCPVHGDLLDLGSAQSWAEGDASVCTCIPAHGICLEVEPWHPATEDPLKAGWHLAAWVCSDEHLQAAYKYEVAYWSLETGWSVDELDAWMEIPKLPEYR